MYHFYWRTGNNNQKHQSHKRAPPNRSHLPSSSLIPGLKHHLATAGAFPQMDTLDQFSSAGAQASASACMRILQWKIFYLLEWLTVQKPWPSGRPRSIANRTMNQDPPWQGTFSKVEDICLLKGVCRTKGVGLCHFLVLLLLAGFTPAKTI